MTRLEAELRKVLEEKMSNVHVTAPLPRRAIRKGMRARILNTGVASAVVVAVGVGSFLAAQAVLTPEATNPASGSDLSQPSATTEEPEIIQLTPKVTVASGQQDGQPWALAAYLGVVDAPGLSPRDALCTGWSFGLDKTPEFLCRIGHQESFGGNGLLRSSADWTDQKTTALLGTVAPSVAEVRLESGADVYNAGLYEAPVALALDFDFFVGFVPAGSDVDVVALDDSGNVLDRTHHDSLPRISVESSGSGSGTVTGRPVCDGCPQPLEQVIDCGSDCWAEFEKGAQVSLEAVPNEGSVFAGWSGACSGRGTCTVDIDGDKSVVANFERIP